MRIPERAGVDLILANQAPSGAFIASPNLEAYRYAWFRDGTFCAHALVLAGRVDEAQAFHDWASRTVLRYTDKLRACIRMAREGTAPPIDACFHCRFTVDGDEVPGTWGNHQLDGLGSWLWALDELVTRTSMRAVPDRWLRAAELAAAYLAAMWRYPCSDWWEEDADAIHTGTLAAIAAGLHASARLAGTTSAGLTAREIEAFIVDRCVADGRLVKSSRNADVDASLVSLFVPYAVLSWDDPVYQATLDRINADLGGPQGVHRYPGDSFYGGGAWVLLTAWLGWAYAAAGERERAKEVLDWVERQASVGGELPEQVPVDLMVPDRLGPWTRRWGPIASPLLWSQAMHLILAHALREAAATGR